MRDGKKKRKKKEIYRQNDIYICICILIDILDRYIDGSIEEKREREFLLTTKNAVKAHYFASMHTRKQFVLNFWQKMGNSVNVNNT